jgi:hypothetical protein
LVLASCRKSCARCRIPPKSACPEDKRQCKGGKSRFSLQTLPADDFRMRQRRRNQAVFISQKAFRQLGKTQYSMAAQDVRYYLNGLLLLVEGRSCAPLPPMVTVWLTPALRIETDCRARNDLLRARPCSN